MYRLPLSLRTAAAAAAAAATGGFRTPLPPHSSLTWARQLRVGVAVRGGRDHPPTVPSSRRPALDGSGGGGDDRGGDDRPYQWDGPGGPAGLVAVAGASWEAGGGGGGGGGGGAGDGHATAARERLVINGTALTGTTRGWSRCALAVKSHGGVRGRTAVAVAAALGCRHPVL